MLPLLHDFLVVSEIPFYRKGLEARNTMKSIGIVGGFGGYATLDFYRRLLERFSSENERGLPHIIMDCDFQMPSRTKAILTGEGYFDVIKAIENSLRRLLHYNVDYIVLVCGNAHNFLPDIYSRLPEARCKVVNMVDVVGAALNRDGVKKVLVLASEGSLTKHLYSNVFIKYDIKCIEPGIAEFPLIRKFIETIKRNESSLGGEMIDFIEQYDVKDVILGCTELPVLLDRAKAKYSITFNTYDPLEYVLDYLYENIAYK